MPVEQQESQVEVGATLNDDSAALLIHGVELTYPATRKAAAVEALRGVSLTVRAGQSVALLGPNGSGKSTLMKIVSGLIPADHGEIAVFGATELPVIRRRISVVFQSNGLDPHLTVEENLFCEAALYGYDKATAREMIEAELARAGLIEKRHAFVKALSLGLARRVDLVRALLHRPQLLLLDEPTVGLDPVARMGFLEELERRRIEDQLTILMTTHLIDEADRFERCVFIHEGSIVADGEPAALRRAVGGLILTVQGQEAVSASVEAVSAAMTWKKVAGGWCALADEADKEALQAIAGALIGEGRAFTIAPPTLADVFADLTGATFSRPDSLALTGGGA